MSAKEQVASALDRMLTNPRALDSLRRFGLKEPCDEADILWAQAAVLLLLCANDLAEPSRTTRT